MSTAVGSLGKGELQEWPHYQQSRDPYTGVWWNYTAHAYDYGNPAGAEKWIERVTGTVGNGFVDGIFLDGLPYPAWAGPFGNCTAGEKANYSMGFNATVSSDLVIILPVSAHSGTCSADITC